MKSEYRKAFEELVATLGGSKNIIQFGKKIFEEKTIISLHLRRIDNIKKDVFVFFENVHCLIQSQGISFQYIESEKMELFFLFLKDQFYEKYSGNIKNRKILIAKRLKEKMAVKMRAPLNVKKENKNFEEDTK